MRLPLASRAEIPLRKITEYLLNPEHPQGSSKARYFLRRGLVPEQPELLSHALRELARSIEMTEVSFRYGWKYAGVGEILCPDGTVARITTVLIVRVHVRRPFLSPRIQI
jgi:hypothetical protein